VRFCSFSLESKNRFGFELQKGKLVDLLQAGAELATRGELSSSEEELLDTLDLKSWLSRGAESIEVARRMGELLEENSEAIYPREDVRLLPPIPNPEKIIFLSVS